MRGSCKEVATGTYRLQELYTKHRAPIIVAGSSAYVCSCTPPRRLGGDTEGRRLGGDTEARPLGGGTEARRLGGDTEARRLGGDTEARKLGGDTEGRRLGGDTEGRQLGGATQVGICEKRPPCSGFVVEGIAATQVFDGVELKTLIDECVP
ncbi:hypothetical protein JYT28_00475 [Desulfobulbus sp. AH-315-M07]|nr:hypothetical protein [Desulfobulbus sp. AH-315-M07]